MTIQLTSDEALVLSRWLEMLQMTDLSRVVDDPAGLGADPSDRRRPCGPRERGLWSLPQPVDDPPLDYM
ncbi:hypothetical protein, partial [Streptomyces globisporus]|uniref:hypothetical protein n=1 Tax=Streptomyces globisporus TaxID=1908 RepID=UPI00197D9A16